MAARAAGRHDRCRADPGRRGGPAGGGIGGVGDGTEQWVSSEFRFTFEAGQTYEVLFFLQAPDEAQFRRKVDGWSGYDVLPYLVDVESRSRYGHDDGPTTTYNTWPPFMRLVLDAPDADGDGVADPDDACPDDPAAPPDADGDGCSDPPPPEDPSTSSGGPGGDDGATPDDDDSGPGPGDPDEPSEPGDATGTSPGGETSGTGDGSDPAGTSDSGGCSVGATAPASLSLVLLALGGTRRRSAAR